MEQFLVGDSDGKLYSNGDSESDDEEYRFREREKLKNSDFAWNYSNWAAQDYILGKRRENALRSMMRPSFGLTDNHEHICNTGKIDRLIVSEEQTSAKLKGTVNTAEESPKKMSTESTWCTLEKSIVTHMESNLSNNSKQIFTREEKNFEDPGLFGPEYEYNGYKSFLDNFRGEQYFEKCADQFCAASPSETI